MYACTPGTAVSLSIVHWALLLDFCPVFCSGRFIGFSVGRFICDIPERSVIGVCQTSTSPFFPLLVFFWNPYSRQRLGSHRSYPSRSCDWPLRWLNPSLFGIVTHTCYWPSCIALSSLSFITYFGFWCLTTMTYVLLLKNNVHVSQKLKLGLITCYCYKDPSTISSSSQWGDLQKPQVQFPEHTSWYHRYQEHLQRFILSIWKARKWSC
jgi:hypothetical protein